MKHLFTCTLAVNYLLSLLQLATHYSHPTTMNKSLRRTLKLSLVALGISFLIYKTRQASFGGRSKGRAVAIETHTNKVSAR